MSDIIEIHVERSPRIKKIRIVHVNLVEFKTKWLLKRCKRDNRCVFRVTYFYVLLYIIVHRSGLLEVIFFMERVHKKYCDVSETQNDDKK